MTYAVLVCWAENNGTAYRWLPIAEGLVAGQLGVTRSADRTRALDTVEAGHALMREYRQVYGEHSELTVVDFSPERITAISERVWSVQDDPTRAALVDAHWSRWSAAHRRNVEA